MGQMSGLILTAITLDTNAFGDAPATSQPRLGAGRAMKQP